MSLETRVGSGSIDIAQEYKVLLKHALKMAIANFKSRMLSYVAGDSRIPVATGELQESATEIIGRSFATGGTFEAWYGFAAEHAEYADEGRDPGKLPPIAEIEAWCVLRGFPKEAAWGIAVNIAKFGTDGNYFYSPGVAFAKIVLREELSRAFSTFELENVVSIS